MRFGKAAGPHSPLELSVLSSKQNHNHPLTIQLSVVLDMQPQVKVTKRPCLVIYWAEETSQSSPCFICVIHGEVQASVWTCQSPKKSDEEIDLKTRVSINARLVSLLCFPFHEFLRFGCNPESIYFHFIFYFFFIPWLPGKCVSIHDSIYGEELGQHLGLYHFLVQHTLCRFEKVSNTIANIAKFGSVGRDTHLLTKSSDFQRTIKLKFLTF